MRRTPHRVIYQLNFLREDCVRIIPLYYFQRLISPQVWGKKLLQYRKVESPHLPPCVGGMTVFDLHNGNNAFNPVDQKPVRLCPAKVFLPLFPKMQPRGRQIEIFKLFQQIFLYPFLVPNPPRLRRRPFYLSRKDRRP